MIRGLLAFLNWLDKRFPPKVTMNIESWNALNRRLAFLEENTIKSGFDRRIGDVEESVKAIKDHLAKNGMLKVKTESEKRRDEFIANGTIRN